MGITNFKTFKQVCSETIIKRRSRNINNICRYGLSILDDYLWGIIENELVVIWAGPWIGKTDLSANIAIHNAMRWKRVALLSLEWDVWEITYRYFQKEINKLRDNTLTKNYIKAASYRLNIEDVTEEEDDIMNKIPDAMNNLYIFDKSFIPDREKLLNLMKENYKNFDMFVIDHLHYLDFWGDEYSWVSEIVKWIKEMTEIMERPVILVSHLSRKYQDQKRLPWIHDLHWSSNIEKNANTIILLAPEPNNEAIELLSDRDYLRKTKIIVWKNRTWVPVPAIFETVYDLRLKSYRTEKNFNMISFDDNNKIRVSDKIF